MSRIKARFAELKSQNRKALIPFVTAGDPQPDVTVPLLHAMVAAGADFWPLRLARELDDAILHLRTNEADIGTLVIKSTGDPDLVRPYETLLLDNAGHWLIREITLYWKRTSSCLTIIIHWGKASVLTV